jgi:hypothetical protein
MAAAVAALFFAGSPRAADAIGEVDLVQVWAYGTPPQSERGAIFRGHQVVANETLETVKNGLVQVTFIDGTSLALGESTTLVLDTFVYDPDADDSMVAELTNGLFHLVSGDIDHEGVVLETPALAIGLRGTEIVVRVGEDGMTELAVREGTATATPTAGGDMVIVEAGQTASASPGDTEVVLLDGLPGFAVSGLPSGNRGRRNLGGATGSGEGSGVGNLGGAGFGASAGGVSGGGDSDNGNDPTRQ